MRRSCKGKRLTARMEWVARANQHPSAERTRVGLTRAELPRGDPLRCLTRASAVGTSLYHAHHDPTVAVQRTYLLPHFVNLNPFFTLLGWKRRGPGPLRHASPPGRHCLDARMVCRQ